MDHLDFQLDLAWALIERGGGVPRPQRSTKRNIDDLEPPLKRAKVTKNTKLPPCRVSPGSHLPIYMVVPEGIVLYVGGGGV